MADNFNPYHVWLGIPPDEQPANHYRLLSLRLFETSGDVIDSAADRQMAHLRTFQSGKHGELTQRLLNEVAAARVCLLDPKKRAAYDQQLRAKLPPPTPAAPETGAPGGSAIHRQPPRRPTGAAPAVPTASIPVAAALPQPADQWDDLLGDPAAKPARRSGGKSATAGAAKGIAAKRDATNRSISYGIAAVVLVVAAGIGLFVLNGSPANGTLVFDWPIADRADTTVTVDNVAVPAPASGAWEFQCPPGEHHIVAQHLAYKLDADVSVAAGEQKTVPADWKPKATLVLNWPLAIRAGADLRVDGRAYPVTQREPMEIAVAPGMHVVQITPRNSQPIVTSKTVAADGRELMTITPPAAPAKLVFDWPADDRKNAELVIDGSRQVVPAESESASFALMVSPGQHVVQITRTGFEPFNQPIELASGANQSIKPVWTPDQKTAPVAVEAPPPVETTQPAKKLPAPSATEQARIAKQLDDLYKISRPGPKDPALAQQLFDVAGKDGSSPAERYMLLMKGAEIAAAAGDLNLLLQGIDTLDAAYEINALEAKQKLLEKFVAAGKADHVAPAIQTAEQLADQAVAADEYELALVLLTTASHAVTKSLIPDHKAVEERLSHRRHDIRVLQPIQALAAKAQEALDKNPADPDANLTVGRWRALYKQDWTAGLPLLAKGSDEKLKSLAEAELKNPTDADQQTQLADAWWDLAQKEAGVARDSLHLHAGNIYQAALPNLASALKKAAIEKRLAEIASLAPMATKPNPSDEPAPEPTRTALVGGGGGNPFDDIAPKRSMLVGFDLTKGKPVSFMIITSIRPIFSGPHGSTIPGQLHGKESGPVTQIRAKPGYAVGGIVAQTGFRVDGFKTVFMRARGARLDAADSYESDWFGGGGNGGTKIAGDGNQVIGIFGKCSFALDSIGLVQTAPSQLAPATATSDKPTGDVKFPLHQWVDVLRLVDPARDSIKGKWTRRGSSLVSDHQWSARAQIPVKIDGDYDFDVEFTRTSGNGDVAELLSVASHGCVASLSAGSGSASGLMNVDGHNLLDAANHFAIRPGTLENGRRYRFTTRVRILRQDRASVDAFVDGKPFFPHWEGDPTSLSYEQSFTMPQPNCLGLGAFASEIIFHSARLRMVSGRASLDPAVAESPATQFAPAMVGSDKPISSVKFPLNQWVDVLRLADTTKNAVAGKWSRSGSQITVEASETPRLAIPVAIDGGYDLEVDFTRTSGKGDIAMMLSIGSHPCMVTVSAADGAMSGFQNVDGREVFNPDNPIVVKPGYLENGRRYTLLVKARIASDDRASVDVSLDGKPYLPHWEGNPASLSASKYWPMPNPKWPGLGAQQSDVTFHSARLRMVSGHALVPAR